MSSEEVFENANRTFSEKIIIHFKDDTLLTLGTDYPVYIKSLSCFKIKISQIDNNCYLQCFPNFYNTYSTRTNFPRLLLGDDLIFEFESIMKKRDLFFGHIIITKSVDISKYNKDDNTTKHINIHGITLIPHITIFFVTYIPITQEFDIYNIFYFLSYESLHSFLKFNKDKKVYTYQCESKDIIDLVQIEPKINSVLIHYKNLIMSHPKYQGLIYKNLDDVYNTLVIWLKDLSYITYIEEIDVKSETEEWGRYIIHNDLRFYNMYIRKYYIITDLYDYYNTYQIQEDTKIEEIKSDEGFSNFNYINKKYNFEDEEYNFEDEGYINDYNDDISSGTPYNYDEYYNEYDEYEGYEK